MVERVCHRCYFRVKPEWRQLNRYDRKNEYTCIESVLSQSGYILSFMADGFSDSDQGFMILYSENTINDIEEAITTLFMRYYPRIFSYLEFENTIIK